MWLKKPVSVVRSKSKIAILLILNVVILGELMQVKQVKGGEYNFDYIDDYKKEAKEYVGETGKGDLAGKVKELEGYTDKPKEVGYSEHELRSKGDARVKGEEKDENEGVREAIGAAKSSYAENPHRSSYTVGKLQHEEFIKKSDAVTSNPISGLNVEGKTECKIADKNIGGENVEFEEYYVDVEDSRLIREDKKCEEDEDRLFYCIRKIKDVKCMSKVECSFDNAGGEGGLYTSASNSEFMSASGGMTWSYSGDILSFGEDHAYLYGSLEDESGGCHSRSFTAKFYIKDKGNVSEFRIIKIHENNLLNISINGSLIRNGYSLGGGDCWHNAGKTTWEDWNFDLKPHIQEGWNTMTIDLKYTKGGHAAIRIKAKQYCCKEWSEEWDGDCPL